jgi:hypothetical protein
VTACEGCSIQRTAAQLVLQDGERVTLPIPPTSRELQFAAVAHINRFIEACGTCVSVENECHPSALTPLMLLHEACTPDHDTTAAFQAVDAAQQAAILAGVNAALLAGLFSHAGAQGVPQKGASSAWGPALPGSEAISHHAALEQAQSDAAPSLHVPGTPSACTTPHDQTDESQAPSPNAPLLPRQAAQRARAISALVHAHAALDFALQALASWHPLRMLCTSASALALPLMSAHNLTLPWPCGIYTSRLAAYSASALMLHMQRGSFNETGKREPAPVLLPGAAVVAATAAWCIFRAATLLRSHTWSACAWFACALVMLLTPATLLAVALGGSAAHIVLQGGCCSVVDCPGWLGRLEGSQPAVRRRWAASELLRFQVRCRRLR